MVENATRIAIVSNSQEYTYQQLALEITKKEKLFKSYGIGSNDIVKVVGEFSFDSIASLFALFFLKANVIPLTKEANQKLDKYIQALKVDFIVDANNNFDVQKLEKLPLNEHDENWRNSLPKNAGGLIVFTSGSTGVPKAIMHDVDSLCYRYVESKEALSSICFLLFDHMGGINTVLFLLFRGGTAVNISERNVEVVCQAIQKFKVQLLPTTPSFLSQLLMSRAYVDFDLSSLKVISYGTEVMNESVLKKLNQVLPNCIFKQTYGLSETGVLQIKSKSNDSLWFKFIDPGVDYKIEDNVLWIRTKSNLLGKILFEESGLVLEKNTEDWFCTNDLVEVDGEYLLILGRQTDIINVGGLKVYPREVENCIHQLPFVDDVFVKGKKNLLLGQMVIAYVLLNDSIEKLEAEKLIKKHCLENLEKFKIPSQFIFKWENFVNDRFKKVRNT